MKRCIPLEPAAEALCRDTDMPPFIFQLPPEQGREILERAQDAPVYKYPAEISTRKIHTGRWGEIPLYLVRPRVSEPVKDIIFYIHGAGWVFGSFHTHEKLVRELAARTNSLVIFPEYSRSPEAQYPTAIEQCYFILSNIRGILQTWDNIENFEISAAACNNLVVAGDSVGGNMAIAMALLAEERKGPDIAKLLLYYPVTNAYFDTPSYRQFSMGYYLYRAGMKWFWNQYTTSEADRRQITASPLRADPQCFEDFPPTMIINGQADVLRSEGEAFGEKLRSAGVEVTALRVQGIIHDFVMLNSLNETNACRVAMDASTEWLKRK